MIQTKILTSIVSAVLAVTLTCTGPVTALAANEEVTAQSMADTSVTEEILRTESVTEDILETESVSEELAGETEDMLVDEPNDVSVEEPQDSTCAEQEETEPESVEEPETFEEITLPDRTIIEEPLSDEEIAKFKASHKTAEEENTLPAEEDVIEEETIESSEEVVGANDTHIHYYVPVTKTITHKATGHYEKVQTGTAIAKEEGDWLDTVDDWNTITKIYETHVVCSCGIYLDVDENGNYLSLSQTETNIINHIGATHHTYSSKEIFIGYQYPVYETKWVEDTPAWKETKTVYKCKECGATKSTNPVDIAKGSIKTKSKSYEYTGRSRQPNPVIKIGSKTLKKGTDYVLTYKNNKKIGTATVTAYGRGNYQGSVSCTFKIVACDISQGAASTKYMTYLYTGRNRQPAMILKINSRTLVKGTDYTLTYKNNKSIGTATITAHGIGNYTGTKSCTFQIVSKQQEIVPVYRLFNTRTGEHFYTANASERQRYLNVGNWNSEGVAWYAPKKSGEPIYRLSNPNNGNEHHYTKSKSEKDWLVSLGWKYDCIAWYSDTNKMVPIYRHYHPTQRTGNHHYTTSKGESNHIVKYEGWKYEGVSFYVSKAGG